MNTVEGNAKGGTWLVPMFIAVASALGVGVFFFCGWQLRGCWKRMPIGCASSQGSEQTIVVGKPFNHSDMRTDSQGSIRIIFSHASRNNSEIATVMVESMIDDFVYLGYCRKQIMYQYSMDIPPKRHWGDIWMRGLIESDIVIIIMEEAYLKSKACVEEFLCSQDKEQAIVACSAEEFDRCKKMHPDDGAIGCGRVIMQLRTGQQVYLNGCNGAAEDISRRLSRASRGTEI